MTLQTKKIIKAITVINTLPSSPPSLRTSSQQAPGSHDWTLGGFPSPFCSPPPPPPPLPPPATSRSTSLDSPSLSKARRPQGRASLGTQATPNPTPHPSASLEKPEPGPWETAPRRCHSQAGAHQHQPPHLPDKQHPAPGLYPLVFSLPSQAGPLCHTHLRDWVTKPQSFSFLVCTMGCLVGLSCYKIPQTGVLNNSFSQFQRLGIPRSRC